MGDIQQVATDLLEEVPTFLERLEANWPWAVVVVAAIAAARWGLAPIIQAWRGKS